MKPLYICRDFLPLFSYQMDSVEVLKVILLGKTIIYDSTLIVNLVKHPPFWLFWRKPKKTECVISGYISWEIDGTNCYVENTHLRLGLCNFINKSMERVKVSHKNTDYLSQIEL